MLHDSLSKAFSTADRMLDVMRSKASNAGGLPIFSTPPGGEDSAGYPSGRATTAVEQYRYFREWVYSCIRLIASRVAGQEIHVARVVQRQSADGMMTKAMRSSLPLHLKSMAATLEPVESHAVLDLLHDPWELGVAWGLTFNLVCSLELTGRALLYVTEENGRPAIFPIPTSWIRSVGKDRSTWEVRAPNSTQSWFLPGEQVVYFYYPDPSDPWGALSPLSAIAGSVLADEAITQTQLRTFSHGQMPGLILKVGRLETPPGMPGEGPRPILTTEQRNQIINAVRGRHSGVMNQREPIILDGLIEEVTKLTFSPAELDFLNSSKVTKSKVLQGYGVSPILLGEVEGANRASATVADEIFCTNKVNPLITLLSQTLTEWLGPIFAAPGEKLVIWIQEAKARDAELDIKRMELLIKAGAVTVNQMLTWAGLPTIEGGDVLVEVSKVGNESPVSAAVKAITESMFPYSRGRTNVKLAG